MFKFYSAQHIYGKYPEPEPYPNPYPLEKLKHAHQYMLVVRFWMYPAGCAVYPKRTTIEDLDVKIWIGEPPNAKYESVCTLDYLF
jgi:hypothetical protein